MFGDRRGVLTAGFAFVPILRMAGISPKSPVPVLYDLRFAVSPASPVLVAAAYLAERRVFGILWLDGELVIVERYGLLETRA